MSTLTQAALARARALAELNGAAGRIGRIRRRIPRRLRGGRIATLGQDAIAAVRLGFGSGVLGVLRPAGLLEMGRLLASKSANPSLVYRFHARNTPEKVALAWRDRTTTWAELDSRIDRLSANLRRRGLARTSIAVILRNRPELVELLAACSRCGAAAVTLSWRATAAEIAHATTHSGARALIVEADLLPALAEATGEGASAWRDAARGLDLVAVVGAEPALGAGAPFGETTPTPYEDLVASSEPGASAPEAPVAVEPSVVVYTSGTTGRPKGAVRSFPRAARLGALRVLSALPMHVEDVHLVASPLYHATAYGFMTLAGVLGATAVLMDHFEPARFLELVARWRVTTTAVVPTMLRRVLDLPESVRRAHDTRSLRAVFSGGAPLPASLAVEFMDAFGDVLFNFYGATETGLVTLATPADLRASVASGLARETGGLDYGCTIGRPFPGTDVRLLDEAGRDVEDGATGELYVKSALVITGYHRDAAATRASTVGDYFSVGDLATRDRRGLYYLRGRKHDMIVSGGVNVYPAEVEAALEAHPGVREAAIVGLFDRDLGERVTAFVVARPHAGGPAPTAAELTAFLRERLSGPKIPREVVFVDELPRNPTGKVLRSALRARAQ